MLAQLAERRIPYIAILTNPTTGGVSASYAMLGDAIIAEPGAVIGFAGPRVIKQTLGQDLPGGIPDRGVPARSRHARSGRASARPEAHGQPAAAAHERQARRVGVDVALSGLPRGARVPVRAHDRRLQVRPRAHARAARGDGRSPPRGSGAAHRRHEREGQLRRHGGRAARAPRGCAWRATRLRISSIFASASSSTGTPDPGDGGRRVRASDGRPPIERIERVVLRGDDGDGVPALRARASATSRSIETGLGGRLDSTNVVHAARRRGDVDRLRSRGVPRADARVDRAREGRASSRRVVPAVIGEPRPTQVRGWLARACARARRERRARRRRGDADRATSQSTARGTTFMLDALGEQRDDPHAAARVDIRRRTSRSRSRSSTPPGRRSPTSLAEAARRGARRSLPGSISARRALDLRRRAQCRRRAHAGRDALCGRAAMRRVTVLLCVLGDKDWRAMMDALRARGDALHPHRCAHRAGQPAVVDSTRRRAYAASLGVRGAQVGAGLRRGAAPTRRSAARAHARHRLLSHRRRRDGALAGVSALRVAFAGCSRAPSPAFATSIPRSSPSARYIMATWRDVARRYAFVEYDGPPLEPLELYTKKSGDEIVGQLYNFVDKGGRDVALRPEMTPTVARMVAARANALRKPVRWFSMPQLFRYERQQKGRLREHYPAQRRHLRRRRSRGRRRARGVRRRHHARVRAHVERRRGARLRPPHPPGVSRVARRARRVGRRRVRRDRQAGAPAGARSRPRSSRRSACRRDAMERIVDDRRRRLRRARVATRRGSSAAEHVEEFGAFLRYVPDAARRRRVVAAASICRSCAASRTTPASCSSCSTARVSSAPSAAAGGTTRCSQSLGGADMPALGFGMGDVVLGELLRAKGLMRRAGVARGLLDLRCETTSRSSGSCPRRRGFARAGHSVEYALRPQSLSKQKKAAQASGAKTFVTLSNDGTNG